MNFLEPAPDKKTATLTELIAAVRPYFIKGWQNYPDEILEELRNACNNYSFLTEFVFGEIKKGAWPKLHGAQSFLCYECEEFVIRLNLWFPEKESPVAEQIKKYFSIDLLHNHNFALFTAGLFGPGYSTHLFRWNDVSYERKVGETLEIEPLGQHSLCHGSALYLESDADFHLQLWPESFSISLNLIPATPEDQTPCQYILNKDRTIREILYTGTISRGTVKSRAKRGS